MEPTAETEFKDEILRPSTSFSEVTGAAAAFGESVAIMARLRGPEGCPWDREQSFDSIRKYTLEETYEVLDAIERRDWPNLTEELGDLLLQVLFYAQMAADEGRFTIVDVLDHLNRKLIRRHPHVFGDAASEAAGNRASVDARVNGSSEHVLANWEQIKSAEKLRVADKSEQSSLLDQVLRAQPALSEAAKLGSKASKVGFDWSNWRSLIEKIEEETAELIAATESSAPNEVRKTEVESELGDLLFTVVNLGRHLGVDSEMALRGTNARFRERFREMERVASETVGKGMSDLPPEHLELLWSKAKITLARREAGTEK